MQNRVDPSGNIINSTACGSWMDNRGQLHDDTKHILRPFKLKAWLICVLQFKDRRRKVMGPGLYTELFFLMRPALSLPATGPAVNAAGKIITALKCTGLKETRDISLLKKLLYSILIPFCTMKESTMQVTK